MVVPSLGSRKPELQGVVLNERPLPGFEHPVQQRAATLDPEPQEDVAMQGARLPSSQHQCMPPRETPLQAATKPMHGRT